MGQDWDLPRLEAWNRSIGKLPPLQMMVAQYLGYEMPKTAERALTPEEHAARLIAGFTGQ